MLVCLSAGHAGAQLSDQVLERHTAEYAQDLCAICHAGERSATPRIDGQQQAYIEAQLNDFRRASRREPEASDCMWGLSSALTDRMVVALARHYAQRPPPAGVPGDAALVESGRRLYGGADTHRRLPSCAQCHGKDAAGKGIVPRLAGQTAAYLMRQFLAMRARYRESAAMHGIVQELDDGDLRALAAYLQSR